MANSNPLEAQEKLISIAIKPLIRELLLVDVADLIAYLNFNQHHQVTDLIDSATEQFFAPSFLGYREVGFAIIDWDKTPVISLEMVLNTPTRTFNFILTLDKTSASVHLQNVCTQTRSNQETEAIKTLKRAIEVNSFCVE